MHYPERRRFRRLNFGAEIEYVILGKAPSGYVSTNSKNLSAGGVCIIAFEQLNVGDTINLRIALPKFVFLKQRFKRYLYAQGRVIWVNTLRIGGKRTATAYEAGIDIFDMEATDRELIRHFTRTRTRNEQDATRR